MDKTSVTKAQQTVSGLERARAELQTRRQELLSQRGYDAYAAHVGDDRRARARMSRAGAELANLEAELEGLQVAIAQSHARLDAAQASERAAAETARGDRIAE